VKIDRLRDWRGDNKKKKDKMLLHKMRKYSFSIPDEKNRVIRVILEAHLIMA